MREKAFGLMEMFNEDFCEVWPCGVQCKPSIFLPCEHSSKIYIARNALEGGLRGHRWVGQG